MLVRLSAFLIFVLLNFSVQAQIVINEICPANADLLYDSKYYNFSGWVELYNPGNASVNIGGYYLSDDPAKPTKWRIPGGTNISANGFLLIWCDDQNFGLHTNFSMDSDGEDLVLSNSSVELLSKITFPKQYTNVSYGRPTDGALSWAHLVNPTPGAKNKIESGTEQLHTPEISLKSGRYNGSQSVTLSHDESNVEIRFTTDGSEPNSSSPVFSNAISISTTSNLKARAFKNGWLPSKTEVHSYFIGEHTFTLPVVSISTQQSYLWDDKIGIYTNGTNGVTGNCQNTPFNWNQDWDRHAQIEFFDKDGSKLFDQSVDIRIGGACSRSAPQKSLVIKARDKYGSNSINEKLFSEKEHSSYGGFILRNSGNDFWSTMFRDAVLQHITVGQLGVDYLAYEPKIFYLNGQYWGIQNVREKIDADYFKTNYDIDKGDLDLGEWTIALEGSVSGFTNYIAKLQSMDITSAEAFEYIDNTIDVQEFINYNVAEIFYCNTDWPGNNVKYWRQRSTNGKWRWIFWDLDLAFAMYENISYATHPTLDFATATDGPGWPNPPWSTLHLRLLLQNPEFRTRFIQTMTTSLSTTFESGRVISTINGFQNRIKNEMVFHLNRWGLSLSNWNNEVQRMRDFTVQRNAFMSGHIQSFFGLNESVKMDMSVLPINAGKISINGILTDQMKNGDYFKGLPYSMQAKAETGFRFKEWNITKTSTKRISLVKEGSQWKYFDLGVLPDTQWNNDQFEDSTWSEGTARLGYGEGTEKTVVGFGPDPEHKYITTYFRKTFNVVDTIDFEALQAKILFDDGAVVYMNGKEIFRGNMPQGEVLETTLATDVAVENLFVPFSIPKGIVRPGLNLIAIEIHQAAGTSSDLSFDFQMGTQKLGTEISFTSTDGIFRDTANSDIFVTAKFEQVEAIDGIVINEFSSIGTDLLDEDDESEDWIELYNASPSPVNLAGLYITDNFSNKTKYQIKADPENKTIIPSGGYAILWADEELSEGPLHVNFKLSSNGESIGLYQKVGDNFLELDQVSFTSQEENTTQSRIPNASGSFVKTIKATPMAANEFVTANEIEGSANVFFSPNPTNGDVVVTSQLDVDEITLYSSTGMFVRRFYDVSNNDLISVHSLPGGVYVAKILVNGKICTSRIVKID
jgi:hypothetical protein